MQIVSNMRISIIIPVYNVEPYVEKCILSVLRQNYSNLEVVIVDDKTPDESMKKIEGVLKEHSNTHIDFKIIHHEINKGLSEARNSGIREATGEYVTFLDPDDQLTDNCISTLATEAINGDYDLIIGQRIIKETWSGRILNKKEYPKESITFDSLEQIIEAGMPSESWNKFIRREFILSHSLWFQPNVLYEDNIWMAQVWSYIPKTRYIPFCTYYYLLREGSIMTTYSLKHLSSDIKNAISFYHWAKQENITAQWYACMRAYEFYKKALLSTFTVTKSPLKNYFRLYKYLHDNIPIDHISNIFSERLTRLQKLRLMANRLFYPLNALVELGFIKIVTLRLRNIVRCKKRINVPSDFPKSVL